LAEAIKALLGLDIVERLETDLAVFRSRAIKTINSNSGQEIEELEQGLKHLEKILAELQVVRVSHQNRISDLRLDLGRVQDKITSQGGSFARNRDRLIHERAVLQTRIGHVEDSLRSMCAGLLPFALIPELCKQLKEQLLSEQTAVGSESGRRYFAAAKSELSNRLAQTEFWRGVPKTTPTLRKQLKERVDKLLSEITSIPDEKSVESIHQISAGSTLQLMSWIDAASELKNSLPQQGNELERLHRDLHRVESETRKIPADEVLKPLFVELQTVNEGLVEAGKAALLVDEKIKTAELELSILRNKYEQSVNKLAAQTRQGSQVQLVPKIHQALSEFKSALLCKKLLQLQNVVTNSFNALCRKKDSVREIAINPEDFSVSFRGKDDLPIAKSQLSAGEKQIYAISMLWGLAKSSGRPLPIVIDTPLGRLDTDHRRLLTEHYFPFASHQVVILSTDSEIDQIYFRDLRRSISHAYRLDFDNDENGTTINDGYFWENANEIN
jgi:DNA sulfur modification protein DndD